MKHSKEVPTSQISEKRQESKAKRNRGLKWLGSKGLDPIKYNQQTDPLFKIKGLERYRKTH
jgi:hypothetical protein